MTNPATLAYYDAASEDEKARQRAIVKARHYHEGHQPIELTDRLREFLGIGADALNSASPFVLNITRLVVDAVVERLTVIGFDSDEPKGADGAKPTAAWAWELWQDNNGDVLSTDVHKGAVRDGRAYLLVDGDDEEQHARLTYLPEYTDAAECDGDGYGVRVFTTGDDNEIAYAAKYWSEVRYTQREDGSIKSEAVRRMNVFWPDRVERFERGKGGWQPYTLDGKPALIPWVDAAGAPLGVPVVPFCNTDDRCEASDAWPMQDLINKTLIDLAAAADVSALGILVALGFAPTTDGQLPREDGTNALLIQPGSFLYTLKGPQDADAKRLPGEDVTPIAQLVHQYILWTAGITSTPASRFTPSTNVKAEGTLKEEEGPLLAKLKPKLSKFGDAWEDAFEMARRIENTFYGAALDETVELTTIWAPTATRDELQHITMLGLKASQLNIPDETLWAEAGYSQDKIAEMTAQRDAAAARAMERQRQATTASVIDTLRNGKATVTRAEGN